MPPDTPGPEEDDDLAIVLEAIAFMETLESLTPELLADLARMKAVVARRRGFKTKEVGDAGSWG